MENNGRKMSTLLALILLMLAVTEARVTCHPLEQHKSGGSLYITVSNSEECADFSWKVNGHAVAHDGGFNQSLVQSHGRSNITFYTCHTNVTYVCDIETQIYDIIPCKNVCPAKSEEISEENHSHDPGALAGGLVATIITLLTIIIGITVWLRRRAQKKMLPVPVIQITSEA